MRPKKSSADTDLSRRQFLALSGITAAGLSAVTPAFGQGQAGAKAAYRIPRFVNGMRYLLTDREAWMLPAPAMAAPPRTDEAKWSSDSNYLLSYCVDRRPDVPGATQPQGPGEGSLHLFRAVAGRSEEVWRKPIDSQALYQWDWLAGTGVALAILQWKDPTVQEQADVIPFGEPGIHRKLLRIDAVERKAESTVELLPAEELRLSPSRPFGVIFRSDITVERVPQADGKVKRVYHHDTTIRTVRADGIPGKPIALPSEPMVEETFWSEDGKRFILVMQPPRQPSEPLPAKIWYAYSPLTGTLEKPDAQPQHYQEKPQRLPLLLQQTHQQMTDGEVSEAVTALWLEAHNAAEEPRLLICANGSWGTSSPNGENLLYYSQNSAWVVPMKRVEREVFVQARNKAIRTTLLSNAKQIGLGLMMYAQDNDETLPGAGQDLSSLIGPYLKNNDLFGGFSYSFAGGTLGSIAAPATTILGISAGPGGQAVLYADGHVIWDNL